MLGNNLRYDAKRDDNEDEIVAALEACFASVVRLNCTEPDIPDLLVGHNGITHLAEVKPQGKKLTDGQIEFARSWRGRPVRILYSVDDAMQMIGVEVTDRR